MANIDWINPNTVFDYAAFECDGFSMTPDHVDHLADILGIFLVETKQKIDQFVVSRTALEQGNSGANGRFELSRFRLESGDRYDC